MEECGMRRKGSIQWVGILLFFRFDFLADRAAAAQERKNYFTLEKSHLSSVGEQLQDQSEKRENRAGELMS